MEGRIREHLSSFWRPERVTGLHVLIIVVLGAICYSNTFSVPFYFDDFDMISDRAETFGEVRLWDILIHAGARRVGDLSFAVNYKLHGLQVAGYHITNLVIHLSTAVVLYFLCLAVLQTLDLYYSTSESKSVSTLYARHFIPLAASLLFVSHPVQTQAVTYIVQRYASLAALFYLCAMLAYVKGRLSLELHGFSIAVTEWGLLLVLTALLGFYTKQVVGSLPIMILMFELCLFRSRLLKTFLTIFGTIAVLLVLAKVLPVFLNNGAISELAYDLRHATSEDIYSSRLSYFLTQSRVIVTYLRLLVLPVGQRLDYDYPEFSSIMNIEVATSLILHITLVALAWVLYSRSKTTNDQQGLTLRLIAVGIFWFYIALSVTSSFIPIPDDIAEHRMYLPSAGIFIAVSAIVHLFVQRFKDGLRYLWIGLTILCVTLTLTTISRNQVWGDELRFWQNEVRFSPRNGLAHANLGFAYLRQGNYEHALRALEIALQLDPALEDAWYELGSVLQEIGIYQGRFTTGEEYLTQERELDYRYYQEFYSSSFNTMGLVKEFIGQPEEALTWYKKSLAINPTSDLAWYNLGLLSFRLGITGQVNIARMKLKELNSHFATVLERNTMLK